MIVHLLSLVGSDASYNPNRITFEEFEVHNEDRSVKCRIRADYEGEATRITIDSNAAKLAGVRDGFHLVGLVQDTLYRYGDFDRGHIFYTELFEDSRGGSLSLPVRIEVEEPSFMGPSSEE